MGKAEAKNYHEAYTDNRACTLYIYFRHTYNAFWRFLSAIHISLHQTYRPIVYRILTFCRLEGEARPDASPSIQMPPADARAIEMKNKAITTTLCLKKKHPRRF